MSLPLVKEPYGRDMSATTSIRPGTMVSGGTLLAEACFRRLITRRGELEYDQDYGLSLQDRLGDDMTADDLAALPGEINGELRKDPRIERIEVDQEVDQATPVILRHRIRGYGVDGTGFELAVRSSEMSVELLGLEVT